MVCCLAPRGGGHPDCLGPDLFRHCAQAALIRIVGARAPDRFLEHAPVAVHDDADRFGLGQPRPLPLLEDARVRLQIGLGFLDRLQQLASIARQPVVRHLPVDHHAADVAVHELL